MKEKKKKKRKKIGGKTRERTSRPSHLTVFCLHFRPPSLLPSRFFKPLSALLSLLLSACACSLHASAPSRALPRVFVSFSHYAANCYCFALARPLPLRLPRRTRKEAAVGEHLF